MDDNSQLQDGQTFYDYHKAQMERMDGFDNVKGSNFDKFMRFIDSTVFTSRQSLDEQDKAHDIDYAHGLELDDIGDNYQLFRNNLDDETYRFLIKSRQLARRSKGTFRDLLNITANLLGCKPEDVRMVNSRVIKNGVDNGGEDDTIEIKDIDITKVKHANLIPALVESLQNAAAGGYTVKQINFSVNMSASIYTCAGLSITKMFDMNATADASYVQLSYQNTGSTLRVAKFFKIKEEK